MPKLPRDKFLLLSGYLNWRLCGRFADSSASQVGYLPFDYRRHRWAGRRDWKWQALAIAPHMLPELVPPGAQLGLIESEAAAATGIPQGVPLFAAAADKACEVLGAGCLEPQVGCLSYGTTATINTTNPRYVEVTPFVPPYPAAIPHAYSEAKGAIVGFGDVHTRAHVYCAILEGLAYALREGKERIEKRSGVRITALRVSGGGSQSDCAMQLTADIFGLPTARPQVYETSGLGAAIIAAVGRGLYPDFASAVAAMTRVGRVFEPIAANRAIYDRLYTRVYRRMYAQLRPLYREIAAITGYPNLP